MKYYKDIARTEGRLQTIAEFLTNGGTEEGAECLLKASSEEIANTKLSIQGNTYEMEACEYD